MRAQSADDNHVGSLAFTVNRYNEGDSNITCKIIQFLLRNLTIISVAGEIREERVVESLLYYAQEEALPFILALLCKTRGISSAAHALESSGARSITHTVGYKFYRDLETRHENSLVLVNINLDFSHDSFTFASDCVRLTCARAKP